MGTDSGGAPGSADASLAALQRRTDSPYQHEDSSWLSSQPCKDLGSPTSDDCCALRYTADCPASQINSKAAMGMAANGMLFCCAVNWVSKCWNC